MEKKIIEINQRTNKEHMNSVFYTKKQKYEAWFQRLECNRRFLLFVQKLRKSWDEIVEPEDTAAAAHDGNNSRNAAKSRADTDYGPARTRHAAFVDVPSDATLEEAILLPGEVPPFERQKSAHQLRPAANTAKALENAYEMAP